MQDLIRSRAFEGKESANGEVVAPIRLLSLEELWLRSHQQLFYRLKPSCKTRIRDLRDGYDQPGRVPVTQHRSTVHEDPARKIENELCTSLQSV